MRITNIIEPEPRPTVPIMVEQLSDAYRALIQLEQPTDDEIQKLFTIVDDLHWYAERIGIDRWDKIPRSNKWSFEQYLWRLTKEAKKSIAPSPNRVRYFIDHGKECVGLVSELFALFEYSDSE